MSSDPAEDIISILYGRFEGIIYSIMKTKKKLTMTELLSEKLLKNEALDKLDPAIGKLREAKFIEGEEKTSLIDPKGKNTKKNTRTETLLKFNENFDFKTLNDSYKYLKEDIKNYFKEQEEQKYECEKCKKKLDENLASRDNYICPTCEVHYKENKENYSDIKKRCNEIFEILDEKFELKLNNSSTSKSSANMRYLEAKYGNNVFNNDEFKFIEKDKNGMKIIENDPYVESTLEDLSKKEKKAERFAFYELIEAFKKYKKK